MPVHKINSFQVNRQLYFSSPLHSYTWCRKPIINISLQTIYSRMCINLSLAQNFQHELHGIPFPYGTRIHHHHHRSPPPLNPVLCQFNFWDTFIIINFIVSSSYILLFPMHFSYQIVYLWLLACILYVHKLLLQIFHSLFHSTKLKMCILFPEMVEVNSHLTEISPSILDVLAICVEFHLNPLSTKLHNISHESFYL